MNIETAYSFLTVPEWINVNLLPSIGTCSRRYNSPNSYLLVCECLTCHLWIWLSWSSRTLKFEEVTSGIKTNLAEGILDHLVQRDGWTDVRGCYSPSEGWLSKVAESVESPNLNGSGRWSSSHNAMAVVYHWQVSCDMLDDIYAIDIELQRCWHHKGWRGSHAFGSSCRASPKKTVSPRGPTPFVTSSTEPTELKARMNRKRELSSLLLLWVCPSSAAEGELCLQDRIFGHGSPEFFTGLQLIRPFHSPVGSYKVADCFSSAEASLIFPLHRIPGVSALDRWTSTSFKPQLPLITGNQSLILWLYPRWFHDFELC